MSIPAVDPFTTPILAHDEGPEGEKTGFDRPWNPWGLVLFTLIFGLIGGGGLLAFNYRYLGMRGRTGWALAGVLFASLAIDMGIVWAGVTGLIDPRDPSASQNLMLTGKVISALVVVALAATQHGRWQEFRATGMPRGKLLVPGIVAAVVSVVLQFGISMAGLVVAGLMIPNPG